MAVSLVAEVTFRDPVGPVVAAGPARSAFAASVGPALCALSGTDLKVLATWPLDDDDDHRAAHGVRPDKGFALVAGPSAVSLVHRHGQVWSRPHAPWAGDFESGCAWFDRAGRPFAVVPAHDYAGCRVIALSRADGAVVAETEIATAPSAVSPVHHPDGWVGLSVSEGQEAARAWWVRHPQEPSGGLEVMEAGWDDSVLADAGAAGKLVLTAPHRTGPLVIRSFPDLEVRKKVATPGPGAFWDLGACFAGDRLVARLLGQPEVTVAVDRSGQLEALDVGLGRLVPAAGGTWLTVERNRIRRWSLVEQPG